MFSQKQKTDVMISNVANDVVVVNGADNTAIAAAGEKLLVKQLLDDGTYRTSGIIKPSDVKYVSKTVEVAAAPSVAEFTCVASGTDYAHSAIIKIREWGSASTDDHEFVQGQHVEVAGDTAPSIALAIAKNLSASLKNVGGTNGTLALANSTGWTIVLDTPDVAGELNITTGQCFVDKLYPSVEAAAKDATALGTAGYETINSSKLFHVYNGSGGKVFIVEKVVQKYVRGKIGYDRLVFDTTYKIFDSVSSDDFTTVDVTETKGEENPLDARRVCDIEWFAMANYGDQYDGAGYPHNLEREYIADKDNTYTVSFLIQTAKPGEGTTYGVNSEATLQIFCTADSTSADATAIETAIETALGITLPTGTGIVDLK